MARQQSFWAAIDEAERGGELEETEEEVLEYERKVREEIRMKLLSVGEGRAIPKAADEELREAADAPDLRSKELSVPDVSLLAPLAQRPPSLPAASQSQAAGSPPPSFHHSRIFETSTPLPAAPPKAASSNTTAPRAPLFPPLWPEFLPSASSSSAVTGPSRRRTAKSASSKSADSQPPSVAEAPAPVDTTRESQAPSGSSLPSFHRSHIVETSTPRAPNSTFPSISTPSMFTTPKQLPPPPPRSPEPTATGDEPRTAPRRDRVLDTPENVPSPIDTPQTRPSLCLSSGTMGQGRRDGLATPVPLGKAPPPGSKSKTEMQAVTKHWTAFTLKVTKKEERGKKAMEKGKGKKEVGPSTTMTGLGGSFLFKGFRFLIPWSPHRVSMDKLHWELIHKLGGEVTITPDTAVTHVIYDDGSAMELAKLLGLDSLTELPKGTVCVRWAWVAQCKMNSTIVDATGPFLSFPSTVFTNYKSANNAIRPQPSRMTDISDQMRGKSTSSIPRKRRIDTSDESEESLPRKRRVAAFGPRVNTMLRNIATAPVAGPSRLRKDASSPINDMSTEHQVSTGPGWQTGGEGARDGLDLMIDGLRDGSLSDIDMSEGERDAHPPSDERDPEVDDLPGANPNPKADGFKCGQAHNGKAYEGPNEWLAEKFEQMHHAYEGQVGRNPFSIRQYQKAVSIMRRTQTPITSGAQAKKIMGIGDSLALRIDEWITGAPGRAHYEDTEQARCVALFKDIYGVGRNFANDLYRAGARSIADLRTGPYLLSEGQKIGLALYEDLNSRIPRDECKTLFELIKENAMAVDKGLWVEIMGSYRRGQETSGDVDIMITRDPGQFEEGKGGGGVGRRGVLGELVQRLKEKKVITHDLSTPSDWTALEAKWMGVGRVGPSGEYRRIDILCVPFESWGAALIYFTGNEVFNRSLRLFARRLGYSLNQRGLYKGVIRGRDGLKSTEGYLVASRTEEEIFEVLGLRWRHPHHRRP